MKFDIVVAHYNENLDWIKRLDNPLIRKIYVYSKSIPQEDISNDRIEHRYLTNVGRESHTYLWHCVDKRREMKEGKSGDFVFFVQGSPHGMHVGSINNWIGIVSQTGMEFTQNYKTSSPYDFLDRGRCFSWAGNTHPAGMEVKDWCYKYVMRDAPFEKFPIFWNACFGVSTKCILKCDVSKFVTLIQKELSTLNPECGHFCERLWYYIFRMDLAATAELPPDTWHFLGGTEGETHYGVIRLEDDGKVGIYENSNEVYWERSDDSIVLKDISGKPTSILKKTTEGDFVGRFLGSNTIVHRLAREYPVKK